MLNAIRSISSKAIEAIQSTMQSFSDFVADIIEDLDLYCESIASVIVDLTTLTMGLTGLAIACRVLLAVIFNPLLVIFLLVVLPVTAIAVI